MVQLCEGATKGGCGECQTSCQSACKTSCTVAGKNVKINNYIKNSKQCKSTAVFL